MIEPETKTPPPPKGSLCNLMPPRELAGELDTTIETLCRWRRQGRGPKFIQSGSFIRYAREDVDAWLAAGGDRKEAV